MPYRPIPTPYCKTTPNTSLKVEGRKKKGETTQAEFCSQPNGSEATIWPPQEEDPENWPEGTGREADTKVLLMFDKLSEGDYVVKVTTFEAGKPLGNPVELKIVRKLEKKEGEKGKDFAYGPIEIESPVDDEQVTGSTFFATGSGTYLLTQQTIQVGLNTYDGEVIRQPTSKLPWIVKFSGIPAGAGYIVITDASPHTDSCNVVVV